MRHLSCTALGRLNVVWISNPKQLRWRRLESESEVQQIVFTPTSCGDFFFFKQGKFEKFTAILSPQPHCNKCSVMIHFAGRTFPQVNRVQNYPQRELMRSQNMTWFTSGSGLWARAGMWVSEGFSAYRKKLVVACLWALRLPLVTG